MLKTEGKENSLVLEILREVGMEREEDKHVGNPGQKVESELVSTIIPVVRIAINDKVEILLTKMS